MKKYIEEIQKIIQKWKGHPYDACAEIIKFISDENTESWLVIKEVLYTPIDIGNDEAELEGIDQDDFNRYIYRVSALSRHGPNILLGKMFGPCLDKALTYHIIKQPIF